MWIMMSWWFLEYVDKSWCEIGKDGVRNWSWNKMGLILMFGNDWIRTEESVGEDWFWYHIIWGLVVGNGIIRYKG